MKRLVVCLAVTVALLGSALLSESAAGAGPLFTTPAGGDSRIPWALPQAALRQRAVTARLDVLTRPDGSSALAVGSRIELNLFPDARFSMVVTEATSPAGGGHAWSGTLDGVDLGSAVLVVHEGALAGQVMTPDAVYRIGHGPDGAQVVEQVDQAALPREAPPIVPTPDLTATAGYESPEAGADTASQIDVMILYTAAARIAAGGTSAMRAQAALAVATSNQAYANNNLVQRLRLVFTGESPLAEGSFNQDLIALLAALRADPVVGWLRNATRADHVSLLVEYGAGAPFCGRGYQLSTNSTAFAPNAFSVIERSCASSNFSFPHELGHNQGANHDVFVIGGDATVAPYGHGWVDLVGKFRTIMAYNDQCAAQLPPFNCTRLQYFSTPNLTQAGRPLGNAVTADNARVLGETAPNVANFRQALTPPLTVVTTVNQAAFAVGNTMILGATLTNAGSAAGPVDIYVGILFPDGSAVFFTDVVISASGGYALGNILNYATYRPIATGIPLASPFAADVPNFLSYPRGPNDPVGGFAFFLLVVTAGALNDNALATNELLAASLTPFTFPSAPPTDTQ